MTLEATSHPSFPSHDWPFSLQTLNVQYSQYSQTLTGINANLQHTRLHGMLLYPNSSPLWMSRAHYGGLLKCQHATLQPMLHEYSADIAPRSTAPTCATDGCHRGVQPHRRGPWRGRWCCASHQVRQWPIIIIIIELSQYH